MAAKKKNGTDPDCFASSGNTKEMIAFEIQCEELPEL